MLLYTILVAVVLWVLAGHLVPKLQNLPPRPFPGFPIIGHLYLITKGKPLHRTLSEISNKYGPVLLLRLGSRSVLLVSSPSAVEECFTKNDVVFANRPRLLCGKHVGFNYTSIAWASYGDHWRNLRRIASLELLSSHRLHELSHIRADERRAMIVKLYRSERNKAVNMKSAFFELTLNIMMRMIAGKRFCGENVADAKEAMAFQEMVVETFRLASASNLSDYLPWLGLIGGTKALEIKLHQLQKRRDNLMQSLIDEHRRTHKCSSREGKKNLIEVLLSLHESDPQYYSDEITRGLMLGLLSAGIDTSAVTMEWAMSLLVNHPEVLRKAQAEMDEKVGHDRLIQEPDLVNLTYLNCIINETMRMYPAGPLLVPHESSKTCTVEGFHVPAGTMVLVNLWAIQNDPKIWEEPTQFKPERFEGFEVARNGFRFVPFGSGRRRCPGEGMALRVIGLALGGLIQCFDWERTGKETLDMTEGVGLTMPKVQPLLALCRPRPSMLKLLSQIS